MVYNRKKQEMKEDIENFNTLKVSEVIKLPNSKALKKYENTENGN